MHYTAKLVFLTPCFSHGSTDAPEVRAASIRGMLHHWFRILGGSATQERLVFGGINFGRNSPFQDDSAGKVVVRVRHDTNADVGSFPTLPLADAFSWLENVFASKKEITFTLILSYSKYLYKKKITDRSIHLFFVVYGD